MRRIPWLEATALVLCDVNWHDGTPVQPSPRQVLKAQMERAAALGFTPMTGSELEFYLLRETYEEAWAQRYEDLTPSVPYILDYHILATTYDEDLIRQIRNGMHGAGIKVETSKGEAWPGQHEINFRFADALTMADNHVIYKNGAKEIANLNGCSITFMAKPFESWIGNSCHIHASLFRDGEPAFRDDPVLFDRFLAGMIACFKELAIFLAPTINSYKRYAAGSWAPTTLAWGNDNRTCGFRLVGHGASRRVETRIPGGDVNPYLAFAAMIAAGLYGIENELELPPGLEGNAYESDAERFPSSLREAILALELGHDGARGVRRPGRRPLPELRAHRAGALRQGRHRLGAHSALRARMRVVLISAGRPGGGRACRRCSARRGTSRSRSCACAASTARYGGMSDAPGGGAGRARHRDARSARPNRAAAPPSSRTWPSASGFRGRSRRTRSPSRRHGIVNGHPSLLPRYRGPSPVAWAIRNGEPEIGFTLHYMDAELDTGNILGQARSRSTTSTRGRSSTPKLADRRSEECFPESSSVSSAGIPAFRRTRARRRTSRSVRARVRPDRPDPVRATRSRGRYAPGGSTPRCRRARAR